MAKKKEKYSGPGAMKPPKSLLARVKEQTTPVTGSARLESPARTTKEGKKVPATYSYKGSPGGSPNADTVAESKAAKLDLRKEKLIRGEKPPTRSQASRITDRAQPPSIVGPTRMQAAVRAKTPIGDTKVPIEKTTPAYAAGLERLGKMPKESAPKGRVPSELPGTSVGPEQKAHRRGAAKADRGVRVTGGGQHDKNEAEEGQHVSPHQEAYTETDNAWADGAAARKQLSASGPVSGTGERKTYSQRAQLALRHAGGFVTAGVKSRGRGSSEAESHRAAVHGLIGGMSNNEKLTLAGAEIPCSSAGCSRAHTVQGNDVVQGNLSCGSRGQNCNIPGAEAPTRRPVGLVDESRATKRLNPSGEKTVPR